MKVPELHSTGCDPLECPHCGQDYLHQGKVEIFNRDEDAEEGFHVVVKGRSVEVDENLTGNPSLRRQGIKIHMECENCEAEVTLNILQHKGQTHIEAGYKLPKLYLVAIRGGD